MAKIALRGNNVQVSVDGGTTWMSIENLADRVIRDTVTEEQSAVIDRLKGMYPEYGNSLSPHVSSSTWEVLFPKVRPKDPGVTGLSDNSYFRASRDMAIKSIYLTNKSHFFPTKPIMIEKPTAIKPVSESSQLARFLKEHAYLRQLVKQIRAMIPSSL